MKNETTTQKATVHYWYSSGETKSLTIVSDEGASFTEDAAIQLVPAEANIERVEMEVVE